MSARWHWLRWAGPVAITAVGLWHVAFGPTLLGVLALGYAGLLAAWVAWMGGQS